MERGAEDSRPLRVRDALRLMRNKMNIVLILDDSITLHQVYRQMLADYPVRPITPIFAHHSENALALLGALPSTRVIFADVNTPAEGIETFVRSLKAHEAYGRIPVVLVGPKSDLSKLFQGMAAGATAYLVKPVTAAPLHDLLRVIFRTTDP